MEKTLRTLSIVIYCSFTIWSGDFRLSASAGYGIPLGCTGTGIDGLDILPQTKETSNGTITQWKEIYYSGGNGLKADLALLWYFRPEIAAFISSGYSSLGGARSDAVGFKIDMSYLPVNMGVEIRSQPFLSKLSLYLRLAPGLYFPKTKVTTVPSSNYFIDVRYRTGFGFSSLLGIAAQMNKRVSISFEINPIYAFAEQKTIIYHQADGSTETWEYVRNTLPLPADQVSDSLHKVIYWHTGKRISFSSLSFRLATSFSF
jgi:hypothetical protein